MPSKDGPDPLAKRQGGVAVPAFARQQMQKPETTGEKADPLKVGPAIPDVLVVPAVSAGHVAEAWTPPWSAMSSQTTWRRCRACERPARASVCSPCLLSDNHA